MTSPRDVTTAIPATDPCRTASWTEGSSSVGIRGERSMHQLLATNLVILYGSPDGQDVALASGVFHRLREHDLLPVEFAWISPGAPTSTSSRRRRGRPARHRASTTHGRGSDPLGILQDRDPLADGALQTPCLCSTRSTSSSPSTTQQPSRPREALDEILADACQERAGPPRERRDPAYSDSAPNVKVLISLPSRTSGRSRSSRASSEGDDEPVRLTQMTREAAREAIIEPAALPQDGDFATPPFAFTEAALAEMLDALAGRTGPSSRSRSRCSAATWSAT